MIIQDTSFWEFTPELKSENDSVECTECGIYSSLQYWKEGEVYCDLCGEHPAMICPICDEHHDHVHHKGFRVLGSAK